MNIVIYGEFYKRKPLVELIESCGMMQYRKICFFIPNDYDEFLQELKHVLPQLIFISYDGADGMEAVIAAKNLHPDAPVIWFSNDEGFVSQSYRLGCTYFSAKPITCELVQNAILRYSIERSTG